MIRTLILPGMLPLVLLVHILLLQHLPLPCLHLCLLSFQHLDYVYPLDDPVNDLLPHLVLNFQPLQDPANVCLQDGKRCFPLDEFVPQMMRKSSAILSVVMPETSYSV